MSMTSTRYEIDQALLPTDEDIAFYQEHGWYITKKIFSDEQIDAATEAADQFYDGHRDGEAPVPLKPFLDWKPEYGQDRVRMNDHIVFQSKIIRELALAPIVGAIGALLAQTVETRLFNSSMAYKPAGLGAGAGKVGWHTDKAYWQTCSSNKMLTGWIPLHDCTVDVGPVSFIDGSHVWPPDSDSAATLRMGKTFVAPDFDALQSELENLGHPFSIVPAVMPKGHMSFHHCDLFHGSLENTSPAPRRNLIVHMQDYGNHYVPAQDNEGYPIHYNSDAGARPLSNGDPDYSDPRLFPTIWRA
jgi:ectoine hydroxylase-related dioxygenase (phytanoyl-CoA dioxygenase family)